MDKDIKKIAESQIIISNDIAKSCAKMLINSPLMEQMQIMQDRQRELIKHMAVPMFKNIQMLPKGMNAVLDDSYKQMFLLSKSITNSLSKIEIPKGRILYLQLTNMFWVIDDPKIVPYLKEIDNVLSWDNIEKNICDFYLSNSCKELERLFEDISNANINKNRKKLILEILPVYIPLKDNKNIYSIIIPFLLSNICGLKQDLCDLLEIKNKKQNEKLLEKMIDDFDFPNRKKIEMILDSVFLGGNKIEDKSEELEKFNLFRHKILHGDKDYLDYGNRENFVRCISIIHYLSNLINKINLAD